jgi:cysteine desulfurase
MIYLDNAATTQIDPRVIEEMALVQREVFGNPSSSHRLGLQATERLEDSRVRFAKLLGCNVTEVIFTSGGTEADNLAVVGGALASRRKKVLISAVEHPAVVAAAEILATREGRSVHRIPVTREGLVDEMAFRALLDDQVALVSIMHANNEIGTLQPIARLASIVRKAAPGALFHTDAVQSFPLDPLPLSLGKIDMASFAAHKLHGPRGVGAMYLRKGVRVLPVLPGGGQERGIRAGTENVAGIAGFVLAAELMAQQREAIQEKLRGFQDMVWSRLSEALPSLTINGVSTNRISKLLSINVPGLKAQNLLHFLEDVGVFVSAGSACHSTSAKVSSVLKAINAPQDAGTLRLSFSRMTTLEEVEQATTIVIETIQRLRGAGA